MSRVNLEDSILRNCSLEGTTRLQGSPLVYANAQAPAVITTAGAATYTMDQILRGIILRDPAGASRTDVLPTAALMFAALPNLRDGDAFTFKVINVADAAETITIDVGTGGSFETLQIAATRVIPQNSSREITIRRTSSTTYVVYL